MDAIKIIASSLSRAVMEIEAFFSGTYPCTNGNSWKWWKVCVHIQNLWSTFNNISFVAYADHFPVLAHIAHDILTILGMSISVKHLFSSSKHTLSDAWSSLLAESALKTVVPRSD